MGSVVDDNRVCDWLPEGQKGTATITRFMISEQESKMESMKAVFSGGGSRSIPIKPGVEYTRLHIKNHGLVMSDTPQEVWDHYTAFTRGTGKVLIHGLGIGMITSALLRKEEVEHITVVEINQDVIDLVHPHLIKQFGNDRLTIICDNALTWKPKKGSHWNFVWHDIWPAVCSDNLPEMVKLHRRFGRRCDEQYSWARDVCEYHRDREKRSSWRW